MSDILVIASATPLNDTKNLLTDDVTVIDITNALTANSCLVSVADVVVEATIALILNNILATELDTDILIVIFTKAVLSFAILSLTVTDGERIL